MLPKSNLFALIDRYHWLWLLIASPFLLFPSPSRTLVLLVVPGLWLLHLWVTRKQISNSQILNSKFPLTPFNGSLLLLTVMVLVSEWATYDMVISLPKISGMVLGLGIFFAVVRESQKPKNGYGLLAFFLISGTGIAFLGLLSTNWPNKFISQSWISSELPSITLSLSGTTNGLHPNEVSGALTWVLPLLLCLTAALLFSKFQKGISGWKKWALITVLIMASGLVSLSLLLTQSRSALFGIGIAMLGAVLLILPPRGRWILLISLLVMLLISVGWVQRDMARNGIPNQIVPTWGIFNIRTLILREDYWARAIYALQDFPFTGTGMNTFRYSVNLLYPLFTAPEVKDIGHVHNEFLQAGIDLGIPGMIAFISLYITSFWILFKEWKNRRHFPIFQSAIILGLGASLFAHLLYGMTDAVALGAKPGFLFWVLLGLIASLPPFTSLPTDD